MQVRTKFEVKQFTDYLNHFPNLKVTNKMYEQENWLITLNDNVTYKINMLLWHLIQEAVPRLNETKAVLQ